MKKLALQIERLPCFTTGMIEAVLKLSGLKVTKELMELVDHALFYSDFTNGPEEFEDGQSLTEFLDDDVRYDLGCDAEQGPISNDAFSKLTTELDTIITGIRF